MRGGDKADEDLKERQVLADIITYRYCANDCILRLTGHTILTARKSTTFKSK